MLSDAIKWQAIRAANAAVPGGEQPAWTHAYEAAAVRLRMAELGAVGDAIVTITADASRFEAALSRAVAPVRVDVAIRPLAVSPVSTAEKVLERIGGVLRGR